MRGLAIDESLLRLGKNPKRSQIYSVLHNANEISLAIASSLSGPGSPVRRDIRLYFEELRETKTDLDGAELLKIGFKEGRELGKVLDALLIARLDQVVQTRQDELAYIKTALMSK